MKQILTAIVLVFGSVFAMAAADASATNKHPPTALGDVVPMGKLGHPIGTYLTIEGVRAEQGKVGVRTLLADMVNGKKLERPVYVWIDNIDSLPKEDRCVINGYESGRWIGTPPDVSAKVHGTEQQALWQFWRFFLIVSADRPKELKEKFPATPRTAP